MNFIIEFFKFLIARKKYWLFPLIIILCIFGGLIVLTQGTAVAPLYTLYFSLSDLYSRDISILS